MGVVNGDPIRLNNGRGNRLLHASYLNSDTESYLNECMYFSAHENEYISRKIESGLNVRIKLKDYTKNGVTKQGVRFFEQLTKINTLAISNTNKQTFTSHDEKHLNKFELSKYYELCS